MRKLYLYFMRNIMNKRVIDAMKMARQYEEEYYAKIV